MSLINSKSVIDRLTGFGIDVKDSDMTVLELIINGTEEHIKNFCNIDEIPIELYNTAVDMCCGAFIKTKESIGDIDTGAVSSVTEGDFSVTFSENSGKAASLRDIIDRLTDKNEELLCFRKLRW